MFNCRVVYVHVCVECFSVCLFLCMYVCVCLFVVRLKNICVKERNNKTSYELN